MKKNVISKEVCEEICKRVYSIADFCREVGWKPYGGNYKTFHKYVKEYNLDTKHFTGQKVNIGNKNKIGLPPQDFLTKNKVIKSSDIIKKLISNNLKEYKCEKCGITEWNGEDIRLQVHHIDGDHLNNELDNLQLLCPNCHSQTDTFAGRKNKKGECTHRMNNTHKHNCKRCGKHLHREPKTGLCADCLQEIRTLKKGNNQVNGE